MAGTCELDEKEQKRRIYILQNIKNFNAFLTNAKFKKDDVELLVKTFNSWKAGIDKLAVESGVDPNLKITG